MQSRSALSSATEHEGMASGGSPGVVPDRRGRADGLVGVPRGAPHRRSRPEGPPPGDDAGRAPLRLRDWFSRNKVSG